MRIYIITLTLIFVLSTYGASLNMRDLKEELSIDAFFVKRDLRDDLLARAATLETQAEAAIKTLTAAGKTAQATALMRESDRLKTVATELKDATDEVAIRRYETEILAIEGRFAEEIRRAEGSTVIINATTQTQTLITNSTNATQATTIQSTPTTQTSKLPTQTNSMLTLFTTITSNTEHKVIIKQDLREELLIRITELQTIAAEHIKKLTAEGKTSLAIEIQREESKLQELAIELKAANTEADIVRWEIEVVLIDSRITHLLNNTYIY